MYGGSEHQCLVPEFYRNAWTSYPFRFCWQCRILTYLNYVEMCVQSLQEFYHEEYWSLLRAISESFKMSLFCFFKFVYMIDCVNWVTGI